MNTVSVIYERGITVRKVGSEWHLLNSDSDRILQIDHPSVIEKMYGLRPIVVERFSHFDDRFLLLRNSSSDIFGVQITDIEQRAWQRAIRVNESFHKITNIVYLLNSTQYHCIQLCKHYASICELYSRIRREAPLDSNVSLFQRRSEPYFEFDALITAVRRAYDSCRYLLWHYFGPKKGGIPSSFYKTLPLCAALPQDVAQRLTDSWAAFGEELTDYRDCIQHYTPIDFGLASVHMERINSGAWSVNALIPDNPTARSRDKFTYSKKRDALSYGWEITNEILRVVASIVEAIEGHQAVPKVAQQDAPADPKRQRV